MRGNLTVVFLSQYFWPEETATAEMLSGIAFALAERGVQVEALAGQPAYHGRGRLPAIIREGGVTIRRVASSLLNKNHVLGRVLNTLTFSVSVFLEELGREEKVIRVVVTNPPTLPWVIALISRLRRIPFILVVHDVYPDVAVSLGKLRKGGAVQRLWQFLNRHSYRAATRIIVLGPRMKEKVRRFLPKAQWSKVAVVPNWADGEAIKPVAREDNPLLKMWEMDGRFVVQYSGNIGLFHEMDTVLKAAELLERSGVCFLFIGDGARKQSIEEVAFERWLENVAVAPFQPRENLPWTLTACDVALVTLKKGVEGLCVPSKFYGILAAGKPVVAIMDADADVAMAIREHGCGFVVPPGDAGRLAEAIEWLKGEDQLRHELGQRARRAYEQHYTLEKVADRFAELLEDCCDDIKRNGRHSC